MKQFNFLLKYKDWILEGKKFRTVRYGDKYYKELRIGNKVAITVGNDPKNAKKIAVAEILELVYKKIKEIKREDVIGDSEAWPIKSLISGLTEIYLKTIERKVTEEDFVTIVRFRLIQ
jgi:hypothetical protein